MVGALRSDKQKSSKPYERKVHFQQPASEATLTPKRVKTAAPVLIAGAANHKSRKRHGAKVSRRRSDEMKHQGAVFTTDADEIEDFFLQATYPDLKTRVRRRHYKKLSQPTTNIIGMPTSSKLKDLDYPSSPFVKTIDDFSEMPSNGFSFIAKALPSTIAELFSELEDMRAKLISQEQNGPYHCAKLRNENEKLKQRYQALFNKHQVLVEMMKDICAKTGSTPEDLQDGMVCDADDEYPSPSTTSYIGFERLTPGPSFSTPGISPASSSSSSDSLRTPALTPTAPLWAVDDYNGSYQKPADDWSKALEMDEFPCSGMAEDIQNLTQSLADLWRDRGASVTAKNDA